MAQVQQPQVVHTTQTVYVHKPILDSLFSGKMVAIMTLIGVILLFLGVVIGIQAKNTEKTNIDDVQDRTVASETQYKWGMTVMAVGMMLMLLFMLGAAAMSPDIPVNVRVAFLIFGAIMIFTMVTAVLGFITPLTETGPGIVG
jgi:uncharacterized membrane protein